MNIVKIVFNMIPKVIPSFSLISIPITIHPNKKKAVPSTDYSDINRSESTIEFKDYKTTLSGYDTNFIEKVNDDLIVYLFIQKKKDSSSWNLIVPTILETTTGKISQYGLGYFALEGTGGGLRNMCSMMHYLRGHSERGFNISIVPKIVDNELLDNFQYADSGVTLLDIKTNSIDLINYRKKSFDSIYNQYQKLLNEYQLQQAS